MADPMLQLEEVVKEYVSGPVRTRVLHGVGFELLQGEFTALMGPSGSGKTTLLNLIGLLDRPTAGQIRIHGQRTGELDERGLTRFRGQELGFIFQFHHLLPAFTAVENVLLPLYAQRGRPDPSMRQWAAALLGEVGLGERAGQRVTELSGGQAQRVAVARALVAEPALVLADEPTGNLDTQTAAQIFELLRRFNRERHTTFLVVTHDSRLAERCDRILEVVDGRLVSDRRR